MGKAADLTGQTFGRLLVLGKSEKVGRRGTSYWTCQCQCGETTEVRRDGLTSGHTKSCGCLARATADDNPNRKGRPKHGASGGKEAEYTHWVTMRKQNEVIPQEWDDFVQFFVDVGEKPSPQYRLSRRDLSKPHSKQNTYWRNANDERAAVDRLTSADLPEDCTFDFRTYLRTAAAANQREAAA